MKSIEERIWDYIDGSCSIKEQQEIAALINSDLLYKAKYQELMVFQTDLEALDLDEPSMAFTHKVMEKITLLEKPLSAKSLIDKRIIYGISLVFGVLLLACLVIAFNQVNWSTSIQMPENLKINYSEIGSRFTISDNIKTLLLYTFFMFDTVVGLMILDKLLRKRMQLNS